MNETIIRADDAPRFGQDGVAVVGYASPSRGGASVAAWRLTLEPGAASPVHELTDGEAFVALAGSATFEFDGRRREVGGGDAIWVPADLPFRLVNEGDKPFEV